MEEKRKYKKPEIDRIGCIYIIEDVRIESKKRIYVGQTVMNPEKRWEIHKKQLLNNKHKNKQLQHLVNKHGINILNFYILSKGIIKRELDFYEKFFIRCLDSFKNGLNETEGGQGGAIKPFLPVKLKNIYTNEIWEFDSREECSKILGIRKSRIIDVVLGYSRFTGDWCHPDSNLKLFRIQSPKGEIFKDIELVKLAKHHDLNINLLNRASSKAKNGEIIKMTNGWTFSRS